MKVVYRGGASRKSNPLSETDGDVLELFRDNWDDYGYKTSFSVACRINGKAVQLGLLRLLIENTHNSGKALDKLLEQGWDGTFPIPNVNYVSTPSEITFYEQLQGVFGVEGAVAIAEQLRDASYLVHIVEDEAARRLVETSGFTNSLQRERGSIKAYLDGWRVFERHDIAVLDLGFRFRDIFDDISTLELKFQSDSPLPHDINVLIGPNGYGKSRVLHQIVQDWISRPDDENDVGFVKKPNLSQIVVVSYSPFELFPVDLAARRLQDKDAYRYFGFRGRGKRTKRNIPGKIRISHDFPKRNAAHSLVDCLRDDKKYRSILNWAKKVETVERVLRKAMDFDYAAVEIKAGRHIKSFYSDGALIDQFSFVVEIGSKRKRYIPIASDRIEELDDEKLAEAIVPESGVTFFRDGEPIKLSSGQRLFAYIVINVLGAVRRNSLILVDEPEIFLHPTLEVQFVDMLKSILKKFNSKALLATHSVVTVREVPADCVHVFEKADDELVLKHPPFQTFGGDFQRISSYVFGDNAVSKPFESWIRTQLKEYDSAEGLINALGDEINEELIVQIRAMDRLRW